MSIVSTLVGQFAVNVSFFTASLCLSVKRALFQQQQKKKTERAEVIPLAVLVLKFLPSKARQCIFDYFVLKNTFLSPMIDLFCSGCRKGETK